MALKKFNLKIMDTRKNTDLSTRTQTCPRRKPKKEKSRVFKNLLNWNRSTWKTLTSILMATISRQTRRKSDK